MYDTTLLTDELIGLEKDSNGRINHSPSGVDSKDIADSLCGATYNASLHAEEFDFEYGETLNIITNVNSSLNPDINKQQVTIEFEEELNKIFDPLQNMNKDVFTDFGLGKAQALTQHCISQGIILPF